jgi:hypothetical protein
MPEVRSASVAKGMVKKACPREGGGPSSKAAAFFDARSVLSVREHDKTATCLRVAASAKAGNAAGGFFQHSLKRRTEATDKKEKRQ